MAFNDMKELKEFVSKLKLNNEYASDFADIQKNPSPVVSTGFLSIDKMLNGGLQNELYILSAESSIGKSAIAQTIAENVSKNNYVLYFAVEMSRRELAARGISAVSFDEYIDDKSKPRFKISDILARRYDEATGFTYLAYSNYEEYAKKYFEKTKNICVVETGIDGVTAKDIANISVEFQRVHSDKPVVVLVDYLQLLCADKNDPSQRDIRIITNEAIRILKNLSQKGMPVFALSSVARSEYGSKVSMSSSKESGACEYTSGVAIGFNWKGVTTTRDEIAKANEIEECNKRGYRIVTFDILKQRNSERFIETELRYYPAYNKFVDEYDFHRYPTEEETLP